MKTTLTFLTLILLLTACAHRDKQLSGADVGQRLIGSWKVQVIDPDGSSDTKGTFTVTGNNRYRSELVTSVSNEMRNVTLEGFVRVSDGFLIETTTNVVPHWLPEAKRGTLQPGGVTSRTKIIRLNDHEMVTETNSLGTVVYTRDRQ